MNDYTQKTKGKETKRRFQLWLKPSVLDMADKLYEDDNCGSRSEFIEKAMSYGKHVHIGENFYSNFNLVLVDDGEIFIGDKVMIGPNVTFVPPDIRYILCTGKWLPIIRCLSGSATMSGSVPTAWCFPV